MHACKEKWGWPVFETVVPSASLKVTLIRCLFYVILLSQFLEPRGNVKVLGEDLADQVQPVFQFSL